MYCTATDIRLLSSLTTSDVSNTNLTSLIEYATTTVNSDINIKHEDEKVRYISAERENNIDNANTTFYTQYYPIGDKTNSGTSDILDVVVYTINSSGDRTSYTISSIDDDELGKFTLTSTPSTSEVLYISYVSTPVEIDTPHHLVKLAVCYLTIALANTKIDADKFKSLKLGRLSTVKFDSDYSKFMTLYDKTIQRINNELVDIIEGDNLYD